VADLVLSDRRERDVLLDVRREAGPFRMPVPEHQLVVAERGQHGNE
jgi:hypothetical protein